MENTEYKEQNEKDFAEEITQKIEQEAQETDNKTNTEAELSEAKDKYVRLYADFENYKRRMAKERLELIQNANKDLMKELLPIADDFDRAYKAIENSADETLKQGITLVFNKFKSTLENQGLKVIQAIGAEFDTEQHEAITEIPAGEEKAGKVIDEVEKGYTLNGTILRYAKVVVGKKSE